MRERTVFNTDIVDFTKEPMFFGRVLNMQRYDEFHYQAFEKLNSIQLGYFWRPEEIALQKDRSDYEHFRPEQKRIFCKNLGSQIIMDSIQGRAPTSVLAPYCSLPELEGCITTWGFFETIHSRSYTYILKNIFPNPAEFFDNEVMADEVIIDRAKVLSKYFNDFQKTADDYFIKGIGSLFEVKKKLVLAIYSVNALEGLRFYVSFACTWAFAEQKMMEGSAKIITLIARDESQHLAITQHIIKNWQRGDDPEIVEILNLPEIKQACQNIYVETVDGEKEWADYLFEEGSIIGLNSKLCQMYVEYLAGKRMKAIGLENIYKIKDNVLPWTSSWLNSGAVQVAPQETENSSYLVGAINPNISTDRFKNFKL